MAGTFLEEVLKRNKERLDIDPALASSISGEIKRLHSQALGRLQTLKPFTDPATGVFVDTAAARFAAEATANEMQRLAQQSFLGLGDTLGDLKALEFKEGLGDVASALEASRGIETKLGGSFSQVFQEAADAAAKRPVLGLGNKTSWDGLSAETQREYRAIFTKAVVNGESIPDTAKALRGVSDLTRTQSLRIARTNMTAAQADGERAFYEANADIYVGYRWHATLDDRTSAICAMLHGSFYPLGSTPPGPPAHPNCRCVLIGVLKDEALEEEVEKSVVRARILGEDGEAKDPKTGRLYGTELIPAERAQEYSKWLKDQAPEVSDRMLGGKLKGGLFRSNKATIDDIVGPDLAVRSNREVVTRALAAHPGDAGLEGLATKLGIDPRSVSMDSVLAGDLRELKALKYTVGIRRDMADVYREQIETVQGRRTTARETARIARDAAQQAAAILVAGKSALLAEALPASWAHLDLPAVGLTNAEQKALRKDLNEIAGGWRGAMAEGKRQVKMTVFPDAIAKEEAKDALFRTTGNASSPTVQRIAAKLEVETYRAGKELQALGITDEAVAELKADPSKAPAMMKKIREGLTAVAAQSADEAVIQKILAKYDDGFAQFQKKATAMDRQAIAAYQTQGRDALEETLRMADSEMLKNQKLWEIDWAFQGGRSNAKDGLNMIEMDTSYFGAGKAAGGLYARGTVPHEFAHHLEFRTANERAYLNGKVEIHKTTTAQYKAGSLAYYGDMHISSKVEESMKGVFWHDYAAKSYLDATEMGSMGVQALFDEKYFVDMMRTESGRRHLKYTYAFMRGRLNKEF
jgi:SPP1 gp7 family putative phage head morphogenesis protein